MKKLSIAPFSPDVIIIEIRLSSNIGLPLDNDSNVNDDRIQGFYIDTYADGYETRLTFQKFLMDQKHKGGRSNWRINHINRFFECTELGKRLLRMPEEIWDEGEKWMWCRFNMGKVTLNLKIADGGGMHCLITG